ncbi:GrpB family protein [Hypericibacter sp.]|uniref:GrpB family protein n=1 Tax=Hypericibacter sp. TaxID=2705401 RepID=UPI003D6D8836
MIEIVDYRSVWPVEFAALGAELRSRTREAALAIHHIGSTAVPGLAAKDVIDIQMTVADLDSLPSAAIEAAGFKRHQVRTDHLPPGMTLPPEQLEKRLFTGIGRAANLHIRVRGRFNQRYPLICRDYLRTHPAAASAYAEIKRQLARRFPTDVEAYYDIKDPVFDLIMAGAQEWVAQTSWQEPAGDA